MLDPCKSPSILYWIFFPSQAMNALREKWTVLARQKVRKVLGAERILWKAPKSPEKWSVRCGFSWQVRPCYSASFPSSMRAEKVRDWLSPHLSLSAATPVVGDIGLKSTASQAIVGCKPYWVSTLSWNHPHIIKYGVHLLYLNQSFRICCVHQQIFSSPNLQLNFCLQFTHFIGSIREHPSHPSLPGSSLPSKSSRDAPPPVLQWVTSTMSTMS